MSFIEYLTEGKTDVDSGDQPSEFEDPQVQKLVKRLRDVEDAAWKAQVRLDKHNLNWHKIEGQLEKKGVHLNYNFGDTIA